LKIFWAICCFDISLEIGLGLTCFVRLF
jgi:hypothetical protein